MPIVIIIDDLEAAWRFAKELKAEFGEMFDIDLDHSKQINDVNPFERLKNYLSSETVPEDLILILDVGLNLREIREKLCRDYDIPAEVPVDQVEGLALAYEAIKNKKVKKLLIVFASGRGGLSPAYEFLKNLTKLREDSVKLVKEELPRTFVPQSGRGVTLTFEKQKDNARKVLKFAYNEFNTAFVNPIPGLVRDLLQARFESSMTDPCHPCFLEEIPDNTLFPKELQNTNISDSEILECYKALYQIEPGILNGAIWRQQRTRYIRLDILKEICRHSQIVLKIEPSPNSRIQLPIQPGMLFIICLIAFLRSMNINEVVLKYEDGEAIIVMQLEDARKFDSAVKTGGGSSTKLFQNLLACKKDIILEHASDKTQRREIEDRWPPQPFPEAGAKCLKIFCPKLNWDVNIDENKLMLKYDSEPEQRKKGL